jgi:hypothetical protein
MENGKIKKEGKNGKVEKSRFGDRKEFKDEGKAQKKPLVREKERGGGSWKRFLRDYETYLEEEEENTGLQS